MPPAPRTGPRRRRHARKRAPLPEVPPLLAPRTLARFQRFDPPKYFRRQAIEPERRLQRLLDIACQVDVERHGTPLLERGVVALDAHATHEPLAVALEADGEAIVAEVAEYREHGRRLLAKAGGIRRGVGEPTRPRGGELAALERHLVGRDLHRDLARKRALAREALRSAHREHLGNGD